MKETRLIMGMPVAVEIADISPAAPGAIERVFAYFTHIDETFSTYKETSEISRINRGELSESARSEEMKTVFTLAEQTKKETEGYFDIVAADGKYDPSGVVKGWAIWNAAKMLDLEKFENFYVDAGGDIEARGKNREGARWSVGIKNPFNQREVVKTVFIKDQGLATSGTYVRGQHIYNPKQRGAPIEDIVSLTVIGSNVYEADRFATAAFAMGGKGIEFIEKLEGLEGYMIDSKGIATMTSGFEKYTR